MNDDYVLGDYNALCSMCGRRKKASQLVRNWQGQWRCPSHNEARHPQDFVRVPALERPPPWTQPLTQSFIYTCSPNGRTAMPWFAVPGCMIPGFRDPAFDLSITDNT